MSQNNTSIIYAGLDIHKATLQLHLANQDAQLPNTPAGHRKLLALLRSHPNPHVICEASGGYERQIVAELHAADIPVSVLNPAQARHFARALKAVLNQDLLDRVGGNGNPEFLQFSLDAGVSPAGFFGHPQDQFFNVLRDRRPSWCPGCLRCPSFTCFLVPHPPKKRLVMDDR